MADDNDEIIEHIRSHFDDSNQDLKTVVDTEVCKRLRLGRQRYGHGVRVNADVSQWTENKKDDWLSMAYEEFYDGMIYLSAEYLRLKRSSTQRKDRMDNIDIAMKSLISGIDALRESIAL